MSNISKRLDFLDFLRFIAAFTVIIQHVFESTYSSFSHFTTNYFQFGVFGVSLFFLISGFVVPVSLERHNSLQSFWKSRIFRLFPLYILSIILHIVLVKFDFLEGIMPSTMSILTNLTMLAKFMGQPLIELIYWTLNVEMAFYIITSFFYLIKVLNKTLLLAFVSLIGVILLNFIPVVLFDFYISGWSLVLYIAMMFTGTVYFRFMRGEIALQKLILTIITAISVVLLVSYTNLQGRTDILLGDRSFTSVVTAIVSAYTIFSLLYIFKSYTYPKMLLFGGRISYSLYLMQVAIIPVVFYYLDKGIFSCIICFIAITTTSIVTYYFVEKPFIKIGKK
ncbi:MAG: hypothetical protein BM557_09405 [Flavobacterium sp. MedPE-SWcel]|uniref:acyltransferase family protein n=1 Tax=uncultured Flavobacterium sp. TaxID=165435 RepID=UPI0009117AB4|nr:acyltransferase [uncultured Flavobacterium sp.]OIQ16950.1 MAG: hypothetical protein BM557_09405 [Flavobacterium sp. MedPE-SWcel]